MAAGSPEEVDALFERYMNACDLDAIVALYEPGATLIASPGELSVGHAAIREVFEGFFAAAPLIQMQVVQVVRGGDDLAMLYNDWRCKVTDADGARVEIAGQALEVVRRQTDGTWRFALDDAYARG